MAETEAYWYRGVAWLEWLDYVGVVERPTEDKAMRRLAMQSVRAMEHLKQVRAFIFMDIVKEVLTEEKQKRDDWTLRQVHAARGIELQWQTQVSKRGNVFIEVVEVALPKIA